MKWCQKLRETKNRKNNKKDNVGMKMVNSEAVPVYRFAQLFGFLCFSRDSDLFLK